MNLILEEIIIYGAVILLCAIAIIYYFRRQKKISEQTRHRINQAKAEGLFEPVSLHPVVDTNSCIRTGACMSACPEKNILGIMDGKAAVINASLCIGHGACFHACPTEAITLCIGTAKRGVDLPHVSQSFETNEPGIYIAGELGGMGLIKNAVEQGKQAVENIAKSFDKKHHAEYDMIIIGAGPAGVAGALTAKKHKLNTVILEQNTLGGTVFTFPRSKVVMTAPMDLPLFGKVKLFETSKEELLGLWKKVIAQNNIEVRENEKAEAIVRENGHFVVESKTGLKLSAPHILLAIGRRGTPRKLGIPGEDSEKVAYWLLEPENISLKKIMVVGGGDSAIETALLLCDQNEVILSYRGDAFKRLKPKNREKINKAIENKSIDVRYSTNLVKIEPKYVSLKQGDGNIIEIENNLVFVFAGGELPTEFLKNAGIKITRKFGEALLKHDNK